MKAVHGKLVRNRIWPTDIVRTDIKGTANMSRELARAYDMPDTNLVRDSI